MAKFNEYTVKATPEDADTLMLYDAASKTNKLSPFSGIWNWMVNKLTNAVINNLQTSNKTVVGALNELNSKAVIRDRLASVDGTGKVKIPYDTEGVALINVSSYNPPSTVEQSLYIVGMAKSYTEVRFDKIFGEKDYIKIITQSGGFLNFTFNQKNALCRIVFIGN